MKLVVVYYKSMNTVDSYTFQNDSIILQLKESTANQLNTYSYLPNVDTSNNQSFFSQLDTLVLQPLYTFIYLNSNSGNNTNFLEYLDTVLFGEQAELTYLQKLRFYQRYRKETSENITPFSPTFFKHTWFSDKTGENQKIYLYLANTEDTIETAFVSFRNSNTGKELDGTLLESYTTFVNKWRELLVASYAFSNTQHHPIYNGTHIWNAIPISLRRRWKQGNIIETDPFLLLVNCCISKVFYDFFEMERLGDTWPIYEAHSLPPNTFNPRYFRVPGPTRSCYYFNLPALWEQLNGMNELEGRWNIMQYCLSRMSHALRLPPHLLPSLPALIEDPNTIESNLRNVDRTQRFLVSYTQTLNQSEVNTQGVISQNNLSELGHIYNNVQLYSPTNTSERWSETNPVIVETVPRLLTTNHTTQQFTHRTRTCDTAITQVNTTYIQTISSTDDSNVSLQEGFLLDNTYDIFSTGGIDDIRPLQTKLYKSGHTSFQNAIVYAKTYIVAIASTLEQITTYLNEFYPDAVPFFIPITETSVGTPDSITRNTFYTNIQSYLVNYLIQRLNSNLFQTNRDLTYHPEIRKLTFPDRIEMSESIRVNQVLLSNLTSYNPSQPSQSETIAMIENRHNLRLGINTSHIHSKSAIETPYFYFQVSPQLSKTQYSYVSNPTIQRIQYEWNETPLFPSSFDPNYGCLLDSVIARRYVNHIGSTQRIRRPITYGDTIDIAIQISTGETPYWAVGEPIAIAGTYGYSYMEQNSFEQTTGLDQTILDTQSSVLQAFLTPYDISRINQFTVPSVIQSLSMIPLDGILSNHRNEILPGMILHGTYLELQFDLHPFSRFFQEWSSARKVSSDLLERDTGNYYIRDSFPRHGVSEFEWKDPFAIELELTQYRLYIDSLEHEISPSDISLYPSLRGDIRNTRENMYRMWNGLPISLVHPQLTIHNTIQSPNDRIIPYNTLPWYSRYRTRPPVSRMNELGQFSVSSVIDTKFHYYGFTFPPEVNHIITKMKQYERDFPIYQSRYNFGLESQNEAVKIDTTKQVFQIHFTVNIGIDISDSRGIKEDYERTIYASMNPPIYNTSQQLSNIRQLDGGGLWLGTDSMIQRLVQYGVDPSLYNTVESSSFNEINSTPQFDTNFSFSGESKFPVLVEYPSYWIGLHGSIQNETQNSPFIHIGERPCVIWSSQRYDPFVLSSILFNVAGEEILPEKDGRFYNHRFAYETYLRPVPTNFYGCDFGFGYYDFGKTINMNDRYFQFILSQPVSNVNTNLERTFEVNFDLLWYNRYFIQDGIMQSRFNR